MRFQKTFSPIVKQSKFQIAMYEYLQHVYCIFSSALIENFFLKFHRNISGFVFILLLLNIKSYYMCRVFGRFFENYSLDRSSHYVKSRWETLYRTVIFQSRQNLMIDSLLNYRLIVRTLIYTFATSAIN